ncbi:MAG: GntR family transcriptional regulator [Enterocloster asparagiformis]|nr:GntR family transcriptional regulator [Enterocloster asparagiformis]
MQKKYLDIKTYLLEQIKSGAYREDEPIPPERDLAAMLGVSRMTVRKAIEELMYEGLLMRKKGSGTFLTKVKVSKQELISAPHGDGKSAIKVISCRLCTEGNYGLKALNLEPGQPFWRLRRIRLMELVPYAYEDIYLRKEIFAQVDATYYNLGLQQIVKEKGGVDPVYLSTTVEALLCLHNTAVLLNVKAGSPILQIKSTFEANRKPVLFCRSYHPGDSYSYQSLKHSI